MKKTVVPLALVCISLLLAACGGKAQASPESTAEKAGAARPFLNAETSMFDTLTEDVGDVISVDFEVYLKETQASFLFLEVPEDTLVTLRYTYSTSDQDGVSLGYYLEGAGDKTLEELTAATDEAYNAFWTEEKITLKEGMNVMFLSGEDRKARMHVEIEGLAPDKRIYVSAFPKKEER